MLNTEAEILKAVKEKDGELKVLRDRFEADYGKWRLEEFSLGSDYDNYTSSSPKRLVDKVTEILADAFLQIRIPLHKEKKQERDQISNAERFIYGAINLANSRLQATVQPTIQEQMAFLSVLRGWFALRAYIHKNKNGETIPDIRVWDIFHTTWDVGADGLLWACHSHPISKSQAKAEYDIDLKKSSTAYDFWDNEKYAVILDKEFVIKPEKHGLKYPPILISMVGATPFIQSDLYQDTIKDTGESILASDRNLFDKVNKLKTYYLTLVGQGVHNPIAISSSDGKKTLEKSPYHKGNVVQLNSDKGEKIEPIFKPTMPSDAGNLLGLIMREMTSEGVLSLLSGISEAGSGYRVSLLTHAASTMLNNPKRSMEQGYEWLARELLTQYSAGGFGKLRLQGRDGSNEYFDMEVSPKDIKGDWFPEVRLRPSLPEDTAENYATAQLAVQNGLLSRETVRDKLLGVQDTDAEEDKVLREKASRIPSVMVREIARTLAEDGRPDLAMDLINEFQAQAAIPFEKQSQKQKERPVEPQYATGMPREVLPSEELGHHPRPESLRRLE